MKRICKYCGEEKLIEEFTKNNRLRSGHTNICKLCFNRKWKNKKGNVKQTAIAGIYKMQSKRFPNLFYIGSSKDIKQRYYSHRSASKITKRNHKIAHHVLLYGFSDFQFFVLKKCSPDHLVYWEQFYISELNPYFNLSRFASEPESRSREARAKSIRDMGGGGNCFNTEHKLYLLNTEFKEKVISLNIYLKHG